MNDDVFTSGRRSCFASKCWTLAKNKIRSHTRLTPTVPFVFAVVSAMRPTKRSKRQRGLPMKTVLDRMSMAYRGSNTEVSYRLKRSRRDRLRGDTISAISQEDNSSEWSDVTKSTVATVFDWKTTVGKHDRTTVTRKHVDRPPPAKKNPQTTLWLLCFLLSCVVFFPPRRTTTKSNDNVRASIDDRRAELQTGNSTTDARCGPVIGETTRALREPSTPKNRSPNTLTLMFARVLIKCVSFRFVRYVMAFCRVDILYSIEPRSILRQKGTY